MLFRSSNRADLIDPAVLRPGRIDRKIKVNRPDRDGAREIFGIYLDQDLPLDPATLQRHRDDAAAVVTELIDAVVESFAAEQGFSRDRLRSDEAHRRWLQWKKDPTVIDQSPDEGRAPRRPEDRGGPGRLFQAVGASSHAPTTSPAIAI